MENVKSRNELIEEVKKLPQSVRKNNLLALLGIFKVVGKIHDSNRRHGEGFGGNDFGFRKVQATTISELLIMSEYRELENEVTFSNGVKGNLNDDVYLTILSKYFVGELPQWKAAELLMNPHDIELNVAYLGKDAIQDDWFPKSKDGEPKKEESLSFGNEIKKGTDESIIYVKHCDNEIEIIVDTDMIPTIVATVKKVKYDKQTNSYLAILRKPDHDNRTVKVLSKVILGGGKEIQNVGYRNGNKKDLRKANVTIQRGNGVVTTSKIMHVNGQEILVPIRK